MTSKMAVALEEGSTHRNRYLPWPGPARPQPQAGQEELCERYDGNVTTEADLLLKAGS